MGASEEVEDVKPKINVVVNFEGTNTTVKLKVNTTFKKVFDAVEKKFGFAEDSLRFFYEDKRLSKEETPADVGLEDGDMIDAHVQQLGGGLIC
ncbi:ubiquitin-like protein [Gloeophyllum trabeum ATCC 11539]|uniref:Ubiquitin-like protein n=1 Tax=Gloeophyllum trabeum (strain ATCC 11539 / FP-39264 / Madison 617) TaxID=670483 RepID=S7Q074_GLOTA|nr:ubiquitin-like protein [Gloeophyllum trabeum ATCC 11539]EPQ53088.1 ubiquitin-like protein [Gloeophyllum trabeum ATCC 11539]